MQIRLTLDPKTGEGRLYRETDGSLLADNGIETLLTICWFTDMIATADDGIKAPERRGYWADALDEEDPRPIGSRFWILEQQTLTDDLLRQFEAEGKRAAWPLLESGLASAIDVTATRLVDQENVARIVASVFGPTGETLFQTEWEQLFAV